MIVRFSILLVLLSGLFLNNTLNAQDPQFSQFYATPMFLNPGLVGINQQGSAGINYRNQWPSVSANFVTYSFYTYYNFEDVNSSLGIIVNSDQEGLFGLNSRNIGLQYAYQVRLNYNWTFRPGVEVAYYWRDLNFDKLVFGDQLDDTGLNGQPTGEVFNTGLQARFFDMSFGGVVFNDKAWFGTSLHHVTEPNQSITGDESPLRKRFSLHGGYKIPFSRLKPTLESRKGKEWSFTPSFNFKDQDDFSQLDLGVYVTLEPILVGLWYRGIPLKTFDGMFNSEALVFMFGLQMGPTTMGYSFDFTLSDLGLDSGGAHELSLSYSFSFADPRKPPREIREVRCPIPFMF
jgi:type IX secretion system PorP/SprF family membrane protein